MVVCRVGAAAAAGKCGQIADDAAERASEGETVEDDDTGNREIWREWRSQREIVRMDFLAEKSLKNKQTTTKQKTIEAHR